MSKADYIRSKTSVCTEGLMGELYYTVSTQGNEKSALLKRILFEEDATDTARMRDLIYEFGSMLQVKDVLERQIFVILATLF